ncbi:hypothetical protein DSECCO2_652640 [anaerobic digester metagenome]
MVQVTDDRVASRDLRGRDAAAVFPGELLVTHSVRQPVDEDLHLPADVVDVDRRGEHQPVGIPYPVVRGGEVVAKDARPVQAATLATGAGDDLQIGAVDDIDLGTGLFCPGEHEGYKFSRPALHSPRASHNCGNLHFFIKS